MVLELCQVAFLQKGVKHVPKIPLDVKIFNFPPKSALLVDVETIEKLKNLPEEVFNSPFTLPGEKN